MATTWDAEINNERLRLKSVINTNPKHPQAWIAAARLEEGAGNIGDSRQLIQKGCEECPENEDVWLEACRLLNPDDAKGIIAKGVKAIPNSVKLWMQASELEQHVTGKVAVLQNGLQFNRGSVTLWKALVNFYDKENAKALLHNAVTCCPHVDLWLALAKGETIDNAKKVLIKAREKLPKEPAIFIMAARLEEAMGNTMMVVKIIDRFIRGLQREGVVIDRETWMKLAEEAEQVESITTCQVIIHNTIGVGVEKEDQERTWVADAEECEKRGSIETARAIYAHALTIFLTNESIWIEAAQLEKRQGTQESVDALLGKAVKYSPQAEVLWLMGSKEKLLAGNVSAARAILKQAYTLIPNSEVIWLTAFKLEFDNHKMERARMILRKARERRGTERVWMKSAIVEREMKKTDEERKLLNQGLRHFSSFFKLWLMLGQLEERLGHIENATRVYKSGLKQCPNCIPLWLSLADLEEKRNASNKVLTMARKVNPENPELWLATIRAESRRGNEKEAKNLMDEALKECPNSGILWAQSIQMKLATCADAMDKCRNNPHLYAAVAKMFWNRGKVDIARKWLDNAVTLSPDIGDFWALYYKFELDLGTDESKNNVLNRCVAAEPKHGEKWQVVSKAVKNSHMHTQEILKQVVLAL